MNIPFLFLWIIALSGGSTAIEADNSENCKASKKLDDLCGAHTFQSVSPILNYVNQLQKEQLRYENDKKEIHDLRETINKFELQLAEEKLNAELIVALKTHIKDLQTTNFELRDTNLVLKKVVESVNNEIDQLKALIKSKEESLKSCELSLNKTQNVVEEYKDQLKNQNETIALSSATISQLNTNIKLKEEKLNETQANLEENQDELKKQKEIIHQMEEKETELNEKIRKSKEIPTSCSSFGDSNCVHNIKLPNFEAFPVLCNSEIAGPGWTVIQQRINGGEDFYRNWTTYKNGFGNFTGDFFLGLEKIHRLTNNTPHELYIHMETFKGGIYPMLSFFARYDNFSIAGEDDKYRLLSLGSFSGNTQKDSMRYHEHQPFSTFDNDNDEFIGNCAFFSHAGWWYKACSDCNLNGKYNQMEVDHTQSNWWLPFYSLKTIKMLIRPRGK